MGTFPNNGSELYMKVQLVRSTVCTVAVDRNRSSRQEDEMVSAQSVVVCLHTEFISISTRSMLFISTVPASLLPSVAYPICF